MMNSHTSISIFQGSSLKIFEPVFWWVYTGVGLSSETSVLGSQILQRCKILVITIISEIPC